MKKVIKLVVFLLILMVAGFLGANPGPGAKSKTDLKDVVARLRLYEGFRGESNMSEKVISSYYLKQLSSEEVFSDSDAPKEQDTLKRVFNLTDIKLMTQATMRLRKDQEKTPFQVIVLNGRKLLVQLSSIPGQENRFRVEVLAEEQTPRPLLETRLILPEEKSTVLGFEDSAAHIYFLSFHRLRDEPSPPLPPLPAGKPKRPQPAPGNLKQPRLIHKVEPKYPEAALKASIEGSVVISATTDDSGNVVDAKVLSGHPLLRAAALGAIKQWKYEPYYEAGEKKPVQFEVVLRFRLAKKKNDRPMAITADQQPKLIKKVEPPYIRRKQLKLKFKVRWSSRRLRIQRAM